ncbi:MAG: prolipoprotein diacylglyceryl transferase [Deltaproteobacteria bacterium]|nr:prolipoprotein diacylglyceryl transferase [Deltaproteobacteria bacterium]
MHPELFSIGPLTLRTYGLFVALGCLAGLATAIRLGKSKGLDSNRILDMGFIVILSGLIGSRLLYIIINLPDYIANPLNIFKIWEGGLVFSGGLVAVIIVVLIYARKYNYNLWTICDLWSPAASIGEGIGRIGCFFAGCCYGRSCDLPWAVTFTDPKTIAIPNIPLHPTQLYSFLSGMIIFAVLMIINSKRKYEGQVFLWFLILHSTARLFIEQFRGDSRGSVFNDTLTMTQLVALIILFAAVIMLFWRRSVLKK